MQQRVALGDGSVGRQQQRVPLGDGLFCPLEVRAEHAHLVVVDGDVAGAFLQLSLEMADIRGVVSSDSRVICRSASDLSSRGAPHASGVELALHVLDRLFQLAQARVLRSELRLHVPGIGATFLHFGRQFVNPCP